MVEQIPPEILVGVLSAGSALTGAYLQSRVNLKAQEKTIKAQNRRASADYILQKEADALIELLESAERCQYHSNKYANAASGQGDVSDELAQEATNALHEFESAMRTKIVFLNDEEQETVNDLYGTVKGAMLSGDQHRVGRSDLAHETVDWLSLKDDFEEMRDALEQILQARIQQIRE